MAALEKRGHPVVATTVFFGSFFFARPVALRITRPGLEAGRDPWSDAGAAGI